LHFPTETGGNTPSLPNPLPEFPSIEQCLAERLQPLGIDRAKFEHMLRFTHKDTGFVPAAAAVQNFVGKTTGYLGLLRHGEPIMLSIPGDEVPTLPDATPGRLLNWLTSLGQQTWYPSVSTLFSATSFPTQDGDKVKGRSVDARFHRFFGNILVVDDGQPLVAATLRRIGAALGDQRLDEFFNALAEHSARAKELLPRFLPLLLGSEGSVGLISNQGLARVLSAAGLEQLTAPSSGFVAALHSRYVTSIESPSLQPLVSISAEPEVPGGKDVRISPDGWRLQFSNYSGTFPWLLNCMTVLSLVHALALPGAARARLFEAHLGFCAAEP